MASRSSPWILRSSHTTSSRPLLRLHLLLMIVALLFVLFAASSLFSSTRFRPLSTKPSALIVEHSFVNSLQRFLLEDSSSRSSGVAANKDASEILSSTFTQQHLTSRLDPQIGDLDNAVSRRESVDLLRSHGICRPLRVYVYDMPRKFTYDLLQLFGETYKETDNLTSNGSPVHRLIEQHSIDYWLWADLLAPESERLVKTVVRVFEQRLADIFYIPFFTTISFFLLEKPQRSLLYREALNWVTNQPAWKRSGGRDHVLPVHHPWSFKSHRRFMKHAIWLLPDLDSTGNWYKPGEVSLEKDVVLPYVPNVEACDSHCMLQKVSQRKTLLFFRGRIKRNAGGKIRSKLISALKDEPEVVVEEGSAGKIGRAAAQNGMRNSVYCLSPAGDTPSSARLFDAIVSGCIPVIVSDELELPFEGILDYRKMAIFVSTSQAMQPGWLINYLRSIHPKQISELQSELIKLSKHFEYSHPAQPLGPEDLTWRVIAGKVPLIKLHIRRAQRLVEGSRNVCTCDCRHGNVTSLLP